MKKLTLAAAILSLAGLSAFAQQQVLFTATSTLTTRLVWDDWSPIAPHADASNNVAFLWATTGTPLVDSQTGLNQTSTNVVPLGGLGATAWTAILNDPNFHLATNGTSIVQTTSTANVGGWNYNSSTSFTLAGAPANGNILVFVIGWANTYANPFLAAAANAPVGWSQMFTYNIPTGTGTPVSFSASTTPDTLKFGVQQTPEPTTLALLGIGSAGLLIFRRRKS